MAATIVTVRYMVPVYVDVDLDAAAVLRVRVLDEGIQRDRIDSAAAEIYKAYEIADTVEWPAWEIGS